MTKHTSGEWTAKPGAVTGPTTSNFDGATVQESCYWHENPDADGIPMELASRYVRVDSQTIAIVPACDEVDANARLIAAAPELLAVCRGTLELLEGYAVRDPNMFPETIAWLEKAIEKAEDGEA